ncbi:MAG: ABC transporter substrate-binding protein, partial [Ilumatobacter sp.]
MDWKHLDSARRDAGAIEVDLIEAYAQGKINRRNFVKRGTVIGLSVPFMGGIIAACGGSSDGGGDTGAGEPGTTSASGGSTPAAGGGTAGGTLTIANQKPSGPLDPIAMQDLGSYNLLAQSFEFLVGLNDEGDIGPTMLATDWTPNDDGSVWTFTLREGVKWQDGSDFTSADVAATMDRLVASNNAAIAGVFEEGAVDASDPLTAVFTLTASNGNLPYLVSVFNAQSVITPASYEAGSTLDGMPNGTGPWKLDSYDPSTGAIFSRSETYWGEAPLLDSVNYQVFADIGGTGVTAMQGGSVDAIQQFSVVGGEGLLDSGDFTGLTPPSAAHREIWMKCDTGQFSDPRVRQALALTFNRQAMVDQLFTGRANIGNDHVFADFLPFFDASAVPQRERDIEMAKQLLSDAGFEGGISAQLNCGDLQEIPDLANIIVADAAEAGFTLTVNVESQDTFYG